MAVEAYPLHWPLGFPRTKSRQPSRFKTTLPSAINNVEEELRRFGSDTGKPVRDVVISSNYSLTTRQPADPGVAVYFTWDGIEVCIPADRYPAIEDNLQAVSKIVESHRAIMRHGGFNLVRAAFRGFAALPPPNKDSSGELPKPWWQILGVPEGATVEQAKTAYHRLVKEAHPDRGGDAAQFNLIAEAWRRAQSLAPDRME